MLTPDQAAVLLAVVRHGSGKAAAAELGVSLDNFHHRLERVRRKLGARTTTHAVVLAWPELGDRYVICPPVDQPRGAKFPRRED